MKKRNDPDLFSCDEGGRYDIETLLKWFFINSVLVSFCFSWKNAVVTAFSFALVYVLSRLWYNKGRYEAVVDEYEQEGYPQTGWKKLMKNWQNLAIILFSAGIVLIALSIGIL